MEKLERKYEKNRKDMANSVLSTYSTKLQNVMKTLPVERLSPPFNPNQTQNTFMKKKRQSADVREKTFFKGATSFVLQAQASMLI